MKRKNIFTTITLLIFSGFLANVNAQDKEVVGDLELWTSLGISKKLGDNLKLSLDQEFRFAKDVSQFDVYFTDFGVDYKLNKHFSVGANYRLYQNKDKDGIFQTQHRWSSDAEYKQKSDRFTLAYRIRFQNKDEDFYTSNSDNNIYNLRNKFSVNYNINNFKFDPFFEAELYRQIYDVNTTELSKLRWTLGLEYSLKKFGDLEMFYRIDNELNQDYNTNTYIIGVGYKFSF